MTKRLLEVGVMPVSGDFVVQERVGPRRIALRDYMGDVARFATRDEAEKYQRIVEAREGA
jgi:hypothetical protein